MKLNNSINRILKIVKNQRKNFKSESKDVQLFLILMAF